MEYNNYYPAQPGGHPPPNMSNQQHGGLQMQQPPALSQAGGQMMHSPMPPQNVRQAMPPGQQHHQQMQQMQTQQQQNLGHHQQQIPSQQQQQQQQQQQPQHQGYHQIQSPHQHGQPVSHSGSPHPQQQQQPQQQLSLQQQQQKQLHNHQPAMPGPLPQQPAMPAQHVHPQSPHLHNGPQVQHLQQHQQQSLNQMVRPQMGPTIMNHHPQGGPQQPVHHHQQNFFAGGPIPQSNLHHFHQQNQHNPHHHHHHHPTHQQHHHQHQRQPPLLPHQAPPMAAHIPHLHQTIGRSSPYYPNILQTEFRIIELNKRLQCRPISRHPVNPLPSPPDESLWWERFASEFFEDDATLTLRTHEDKPVEYTIGRTLIPRFFKTYFDGGVTDLSISLRNPKETCLHPQMITLDCDQAFIITNNIFRHPAVAPNQGVVVHTEGHLILEFVNNSFDTLSIKSWRFFTRGSREYIDRTIFTTIGLPNSYLAEPVTRNGLTKSTVSYLKMCMIMEPMQDLMLQHKQTKMDPRSCLRKLLFDRYKHRSTEDNRATTNKRRKRKPSAAPAITGAVTNKKSKANVNSSLSINSGLNNNIMMSPSGNPTNFSLASQDVMVVGEPSMMGGDFGDDNERMITRLENTQYDPTATTPSNGEESNSLNVPSTENDNGINSSNSNLDQNIDNHIMSPSLLQHRQHQQQMPQNSSSPQRQPIASQPDLQYEQGSPQMSVQQQAQQQQHHHHHHQQQHASIEMEGTNHDGLVEDQLNQTNLNEQLQHKPMSQESDQQQLDLQQQQMGLQDNDINQVTSQIVDERPIQEESQCLSQEPVRQNENESDQHVDDGQEQQQQMQPQLILKEETKLLTIAEDPMNDPDSNMMLGINSYDQSENHANSIQHLNDESNSNSQLPCSSATTTSAMEQQQPVDNGVA